MSDPTDPDADDAVAPPGLDPEDLFHSRIVIQKDGKVVIENLSMDLMELALLLDPDAPIACDVGDDD